MGVPYCLRLLGRWRSPLVVAIPFVAARTVLQLFVRRPGQRRMQRVQGAHTLFTHKASEGAQGFGPLEQSGAQVDQPRATPSRVSACFDASVQTYAVLLGRPWSTVVLS